MEFARRLIKGKQYSQDELIPELIRVINENGGTVDKQIVDEKMYHIFESSFSKEVYQQKVANNIPRWKHDIAWAKERAKQHHHYVKSALVAGRGVWELTEKGRAYANTLIKQKQSSSTVIRRKKSSALNNGVIRNDSIHL